MKKLLFLSLLLVPLSAPALDWVGPTCTLLWDHSTPDVVQEYRVFIDGVKAGATPDQTITCAALAVTEGRHDAYVTAYNPSGESGASNTVPFVFTVSAPVAPTGAAISP
jgi:hypothetical protein